MKNLKMIGAAFCAVVAIFGFANLFSPSSSGSQTAYIVLTLVPLALMALLIFNIEKDNNARTKSSAEEYLASAEQYLSEKRQEGDEYYESKKDEADKYHAAKQLEGDTYCKAQKEKADRYYAFGERYLEEKQRDGDEYLAAKQKEGDGYLAEKQRAGDAYFSDKQREGDAYFKAKTGEADSYYVEKVKNADDQYKKQIEEDSNRHAQLTTEISKLESLAATLNATTLVEATRIDAYENLKSDEVKNQLTMLQGRQDGLARDGKALVITSKSGAKRMDESQKKQILRCFNAECSNLLESVTVRNVDSVRARIQRSFDVINKIFSVDGMQISQEYLSSKFEELSLIYAYMIKEDEEREQRKAIREQMVEEEKVRREIEREKQKLEKETAQFSNEVKKLIGYMQDAKDDLERKLYIDKIEELQQTLRDLEADKENVLQREQNTRAGFVYIISNIGSFGERVFKIGMTRRLEPMDRISELSSASVPFPFDVHAMIFSEDAPALEAVLHQHFNAERVNKVNVRKEFFRADLDAIKDVVLKNHNATVKFFDIPDALEYRETLRISEVEQ